MNRQVSMLWIGGPLSHFERLSILSFVRKSYLVNVYSYDSTLEVPEGAMLLPASEILEVTDVFADGQIKKPYAMFSDLFRYKLLQKVDTTWVDCDVIMLGESLPQTEYLFGHQSSSVVNCAVLRVPSDSVVVDELVSRSCGSMLEKWQWGDTGPQLLTRIVYEFGLQRVSLRAKKLYPIRYQDAWMLFDPKSTSRVKRKIKNSITLHVWNEVIARGNPNFRSELPPKGSFMDQLLQDLDVKRPDLPTMKDEVVKVAVRQAKSPIRKVKKFARRIRTKLKKIIRHIRTS